LRVEVVLEDQRQDLVRDAVDVSIRMGKLTDSAATAQLLASVPRVILAARSYIERAGLPAVPADLTHHRIIGSPSGTNWTFERNGEVIALELKPQVTVNDNEGAVVAAISGLGICWTAMRTARKEVLDGSLIEILPDWKRPTVDIHAYFPLDRGARRAARALVAYLQTELSRQGPSPT
jgi:DNA-binding transcriptional LysR family regulator